MDFLMKRDDIQPVILGGDMSTYPLAREFYEAFGVASYVVAIDAIAVIKKSRFVKMFNVADNGQDSVKAAVCKIAEQNADKKVILIANTDDRVELIENIQGELPANVVCPLPPHDLMSEVSDKVRFQELCASYGLDVPKTEIVSLAGAEHIAPTKISFPLIAKPAASSEYNHFIAQGFQKVYFVQDQTELSGIWASLRAAGFGGEFLVQELIEGDDTFMDSLTIYVAKTTGKVAMLSGAHVLLEDHAPTLFGNPVAMITKPMEEMWEQATRLLEGIGWYGFANIDIKRDPKNGRKLFLDLNPRIGANSYYSAAAGVNPMYVLVRDVIDGVSEHVQISDGVLYHRIPVKLTRKYLRAPKLIAKFDRVVAAGKTVNPLRCKDDTLGSRWAGFLMEKNFVRKFARYYPKPTDTSF